jgi:response regulator of citrate/malate metabolism
VTGGPPSDGGAAGELPALRVLVVDDDYMVARVHSAFVERTPGFCVVGTASDGAGALEAVRRLQPDLVLLDVYLPDRTGLDVLREVRASAGPESSVDVLLVTAASDAETVTRALHGGVASYLVKPFSYDDLRARLEHLAAVRSRLADLPTDEAGVAAQSELDRLFAPELQAAQPVAPLPKGLSPETMALVRDVLRDAGGEGVSASECAERTGLSRVSARRYLEHCAQSGTAVVQARYGGTGRPERRFRTP